MPISYPRQVFRDGPAPGDQSSPKERYVLFKISTEEILNNNAEYPDINGADLTGELDPDLIYLHKEEPFPSPDYDSRHRQLVVDQTPDLENGIWNTTYTTQLRPVDDRKLAVENEEQSQFFRHFSVERLAIENALMIGLIYAFTVDAQTIPPKWRTKMDAYKARVQNKILPNIDRAVAILQNLDTNPTVEDDLDAGWTAPD